MNALPGALRGLLLLLLLTVLSAGSGCGKSDQDGSAAAAVDPTCDAIGARLVTLAGADMGRMGEREQQIMERQRVQLRDAYVASCKETPWPEEARACFLAAASGEAFDQCARQYAKALSAHPRREAATGSPAPTPAPAQRPVSGESGDAGPPSPIAPARDGDAPDRDGSPPDDDAATAESEAPAGR